MLFITFVSIAKTSANIVANILLRTFRFSANAIINAKIVLSKLNTSHRSLLEFRLKMEVR